MRISTRSCPAWVWTSDAYLACCGPMCETWSILSLMPVSLVKRWPISASFLSEAGAKLFQQRYEISRCWPRAGGTRVARMPARPPAAVVRKRRSEEHTSELQSRLHLVCRLLLEKKKQKI